MAVWENTKLVVIGLSVLLAGWFAISLRWMVVFKGVYIDDQSDYQPILVDVDIRGAAMFPTTMFVDFVILSLTVYKTYIEYKNMYYSGLIRLIFRDGLAYFAVV